MSNLPFLRSFLEVHEVAGDETDRGYYVHLGYALDIISKDRSGARRDVSSIIERLIPAIKHKKVKFLFNEDGDPVAYIIWAEIGEVTEYRILTQKCTTLHFSEWGEGDRVWVLEVVSLPGHFAYVLRYSRDRLFTGHNKIRYMTHRHGVVRIVEIERMALKGLLRNMGPWSGLCRCGAVDCKTVGHSGNFSEND